MPKTDINYANTIIYKIVCKDPKIKYVYVDYTSNFIQRKYSHHKSCKNIIPTTELGKIIVANGGWENWNMVEIEKYACVSASAAYSRRTDIYNEIVSQIMQTTKMGQVKNVQKSGHKNPKNPQQYLCEKCDYNTCNKKDYTKHLTTYKHNKIFTSHLVTRKSQNTFVYMCPSCNKIYQTNSGMLRHKKKCLQLHQSNVAQEVIQEVTHKETQEESREDNKTYITNEMMCEILKEMAITNAQNAEVNAQNVELQKQNAEFQEKLLEFMKNNQNSNITNITNNNNGGNTNNVQINMDTFLTRCCKDAPTIHDFLKSIQITLEEMYCMGKEGTKKTVSRILDRVLKDIEITERPFHCTDAKRHVNYIKETEGWLKTQDQEHLINFCNSISRKCGSRYVEFSKTEEHLIKYGPNLSEIGLQIILEANGGKAGWSHNHTISANLLEAKYHINKEDMKDAIQKLTEN